jgi:hypothetical protein
MDPLRTIFRPSAEIRAQPAKSTAEASGLSSSNHSPYSLATVPAQAISLTITSLIAIDVPETPGLTSKS